MMEDDFDCVGERTRETILNENEDVRVNETDFETEFGRASEIPALDETRIVQVPQSWGDFDDISGESEYCPSDELRSLHSSDSEYEGASAPRPVTERDLIMNTVTLVEGQQFANSHDFRNALRSHALKNKYGVNWIASESRRVTAECINQCGWRIHASRIGKDGPITIKKYNPNHSETCPEIDSNKLANSQFLAEKYVSRWRADPDWKYAGYVQQIDDDMSIDVSRYKLYRSKKKAFEMVEGNAEEQYEYIREYAQLIMDTMPGSSVKVKADIQPDGKSVRFKRVFYALEPIVKGFKEGCRPCIGLDGCFLKTKYKGQLLSAVGRDTDKSFYPIAFGVVEVESKETWNWFMNHLLEVLGHPTGITWISDRQKGLDDVFSYLLPHDEHRFCIMHIHANFKKQWPGAHLKKLVHNASLSCTLGEFQRYMQEIKEIDENAFDYLDKIPSKQWSKHGFRTDSKCDINSNNMCESWNKYILKARNKPIIYLLEMIRRKMMTRYQVKKEAMEKENGLLVPEAKLKLAQNKERHKKCLVLPAGRNKFEVQAYGVAHVVDLNVRSCTCNQWSLTGIPCVHACASILKRKLNLEDYVSEYYHRNAYLKAYGEVIEPIALTEMRKIQGVLPMLPPIPHVQPGRPKTTRVRAVGEENGKKSARKRVRAEVVCNNCRQLGHNIRSCKNTTRVVPTVGSSNKGGRPMKKPYKQLNVPIGESSASHAQTECNYIYVNNTTRGRGRSGFNGRGRGNIGGGGGNRCVGGPNDAEVVIDNA